MRKLTNILLFILLATNLCFSISIDLKTKLDEKIELSTIEEGAAYFLKKKGISIVEANEDFSVWLKNLERLFKGNGKYSYKLTVKLSFPTTFREKAAIEEKTIHFEISFNEPLKFTVDELKYDGDNRERLMREAHLGGLAVANCIENFLRSRGLLK